MKSVVADSVACRGARMLLVLCTFAALVAFALPVAVGGAETTCHVSGKKPFTPFGLEVCYMYAHRTCCLSGYDQQYVKAAYTDILPYGSGCKGGSQRTYASLYALRQFLCLPCDPDEPSYRFRSAVGDVAEGGIVPPSTNSEANEYTWRICRSFLYGKGNSDLGLWGKDGNRYDQCGVTLQTCTASPVFNLETAQFTFPSSSCTSTKELVVPSVAFKDVADPGLAVLLRVAQTMPDFQMVIVNDSDPAFDYEKTPCFGRVDAAAPPALGVRPHWLTLSLLTLVAFLA